MSFTLFKREVHVRVHHFLPRVTVSKPLEVQDGSDYGKAVHQPETLSKEMYGFGGFMR